MTLRGLRVGLHLEVEVEVEILGPSQTVQAVWKGQLRVSFGVIDQASI